MSSHEKSQTTRRGFLGSIATGAAAMSIATLSPLQQLHASPETSHIPNPDDPENYLKTLTVSTAWYLMLSNLCGYFHLHGQGISSSQTWTNRHT